MFFTGAGIQRGQVIGQSDRDGAYPVTRGYGPADLAASIYASIGVDPDDRVRDFQGRPVGILDHGAAIERLF